MIRKILRTGTKWSLKELILNLEEQLMYAEDDVAYYKAILGGNWPGARRYLATSLITCLTNEITQTKEKLDEFLAP